MQNPLPLEDCKVLHRERSHQVQSKVVLSLRERKCVSRSETPTLRHRGFDAALRLPFRQQPSRFIIGELFDLGQDGRELFIIRRRR